jgi:retron-type reverse transcriptase
MTGSISSPFIGHLFTLKLTIIKDKRPFTIPSPIDRIVHRSIATVLDEIFDPVFLPVYHVKTIIPEWVGSTDLMGPK